ncbi:MAG: DUF1232 domain-containing protein [Selenomonadaceae bacterium]|nr:DUF1232 domain-containing protein [Selenomonadaceae bacterium]
MEYDGTGYKKADVDKFAKNYSERGLFDKITGNVKKAGLSLIYKALQLFYVAKNPNVPMKIRAAIIAPLGYFISPIDFIPDLVPIMGYTDDAAIIATAMVIAQAYVNEEVKRSAREKIRSLFGDDAVAELD